MQHAHADRTAPLRVMMLRLQQAAKHSPAGAVNGSAANGYALHEASLNGSSVTEKDEPKKTAATFASIPRPKGETFASVFMPALLSVLGNNEPDLPLKRRGRETAARSPLERGETGEVEAYAKTLMGSGPTVRHSQRLYAGLRLMSAIKSGADGQEISGIFNAARLPSMFQYNSRAHEITMKYFAACDFVAQVAEHVARGKEVPDLALYRAFQRARYLDAITAGSYEKAVTNYLELGTKFDSVLRDWPKANYSREARYEIMSHGLTALARAGETGTSTLSRQEGCLGLAQHAFYQAGRMFDEHMPIFEGICGTRDVLFSAARLAGTAFSSGLLEGGANWGRRVRDILKLMPHTDPAAVDLHSFLADQIETVAVAAEKAVRGRKDGKDLLRQAMDRAETLSNSLQNADYAALTSHLVSSALRRAA